MNYDKNYSRCRQFIPPGWGTARMVQPCYRRGRPVQFQATLQGNSCRPAYQPIVIPAQSGINAAKDESIRGNPDKCHGRRFCPPANNIPINVHLKMCPMQTSPPSGDGCGYSGNGGSMQAQYGSGGGGGGGGGMGSQMGQSSLADDYCRQCPNTCPLPRCPPGVKVERTLPIIPFRRLQESYFKMPSSSVYKSDYVERKVTPTKSFAPERSATESHGEFQKESLSKIDYVAHPICPYRKPPWAYAKQREESNLKLNGVSCYKTDYIPKEGKPARSAKPVPFIDAELPPVDDRTVYQVEFIPHVLPEKFEGFKAKALAEARISCLPFDGLTIYKRDYIPKRGKPALSVLDKERRYVKDLMPMDGTTTYKSSFGPFYFDDLECIPAELYDSIYPPPDKCAQVRCYPEAERILENPVQPPVPPCRPREEKPYCPTPCEMRCAPREMPCVPPYILKKEANDDATVIRVEHNYGRDGQYKPIEYTCHRQPCKPGY